MDQARDARGAGRDAQARRVVWIIFLSLPMGVAALWTLALVSGNEPTGSGGPGGMDGDLAFWLWAAVALGGFAGALLFRGRAVATAEQAAREGRPGSAGGAVQSGLIIAWALLEAGALLAGVFVFLGADARLLWYAAAVYLIGLVLTYPRAEWFGIAQR